MGNLAPDEAQRQTPIQPQYFFAILLIPLHGYYNFIRHNGWLNGTIGLLKETATLVLLVHFYLGNSHASRDNKRHIAERNVRRAIHAANMTGIAFIAFGLVWGCYVLTTHDISDSENSFVIMNNRVYLVALMTVVFFIQLCSLKPGMKELEFFKYILRYPWRFMWPARQTELFGVGEIRR